MIRWAYSVEGGEAIVLRSPSGLFFWWWREGQGGWRYLKPCICRWGLGVQALATGKEWRGTCLCQRSFHSLSSWGERERERTGKKLKRNQRAQRLVLVGDSNKWNRRSYSISDTSQCSNVGRGSGRNVRRGKERSFWVLLLLVCYFGVE